MRFLFKTDYAQDIQLAKHGGHIVKHVYTDFEHKPLEVHFNKDGKAKGGEHILSHLSKHGGLPGLEKYDEHDASETEGEIDD